MRPPHGSAPRFFRLAVMLALVAMPACKRPDPGTKNRPKRGIEAGLGVDAIDAALSPDETPKGKTVPADPTAIAPTVAGDPIPPPGAAVTPTLSTANQVSEVHVRAYDPQDKKEIVGKPRPSASSLGGKQP